MEYRHLLFDKQGGIATLTLNRPETLNALNVRLRYEICMALQECGDDDEVRVVVIKGAGRSFCAGDDLRSDAAPPPPSQRKGPGDVVLALRDLLKPVITQVHGHVYGAGLEIVLGSDLCIAAENALFCTPFVKRGIGYGGNMLPRFIGLRRASEMIFTGEPISAEKAVAWGLINRAVPADQLEAEVATWAEPLAKAPTVPLGAMKVNITKGWSMSLEAGYDLVQAQSARARTSQDAAEGRLAFREKREPVFTGR